MDARSYPLVPARRIAPCIHTAVTDNKKPDKGAGGTFVRRISGRSVLFLDIRHKGKMTCSLDGDSERSLMLRTVPGDPSGKDLSSLGNILPKLCYILVIDLIVLFSTEHTDFFSSAAASSLHGRIRSFTSIIISHDAFLLFLLN